MYKQLYEKKYKECLLITEGEFVFEEDSSPLILLWRLDTILVIGQLLPQCLSNKKFRHLLLDIPEVGELKAPIIQRS